MSKLQFYEGRYHRYLRKISHEFKNFKRPNDKFNYDEGNHNYNIKKPNLIWLLLKIIFFFILCLWFYVDTIGDILISIYYARCSKWTYFCLSFLFILLPIFINTANECQYLIASEKRVISKTIAYKQTVKKPYQILIIFIKKIFLIDMFEK